MNPGTALDGIYVLGSKGLRGHMTDGKYNAGAGILPTETPLAWLVVLQPQDYFQYDVNVRMKCLHTQSKPNHDGTRHMLPRCLRDTSQMLPSCLPDALGCLRMSPICLPNAPQMPASSPQPGDTNHTTEFHQIFIEILLAIEI